MDKKDLAKLILQYIIAIFALICVNVMAFVYDSEWIKIAIMVDSIVLGAVMGVSIQLPGTMVQLKKIEKGAE